MQTVCSHPRNKLPVRQNHTQNTQAQIYRFQFHGLPRTITGDGRSCHHALERYVPSAVSTLIFSPSLMKGGTCTTNPVSVLAGLVTLEAVALFRPGSVSTTVRITVCGSSMPTALPSKNSTLICRLGVRYSTDSPRMSRVR